MGIVLKAAALWALALLPAAVSAETMTLKSGEELEAVSIIPEKRALRVVANFAEREILKKELTEEQVARYFGGQENRYLSFETRKVAGNTEYAYNSNGKLTGRRVFSPDGELLRAEGYVVDGVYREYYPGDRVQREISIANGKQNGPLRQYFKDGTLQSETWYMDDKMHGTKRQFDSDGNLVAEEKYVAGRVVRPGGRQSSQAGGARKKT